MDVNPHDSIEALDACAGDGIVSEDRRVDELRFLVLIEVTSHDLDSTQCREVSILRVELCDIQLIQDSEGDLFCFPRSQRIINDSLEDGSHCFLASTFIGETCSSKSFT